MQAFMHIRWLQASLMPFKNGSSCFINFLCFAFYVLREVHGNMVYWDNTSWRLSTRRHNRSLQKSALSNKRWRVLSLSFRAVSEPVILTPPALTIKTSCSNYYALVMLLKHFHLVSTTGNYFLSHGWVNVIFQWKKRSKLMFLTIILKIQGNFPCCTKKWDIELNVIFTCRHVILWRPFLESLGNFSGP